MKIDDAVPIPPRPPRKPTTEAGALGRKLKKGQSVLCKTVTERETIRSAIKRGGGSYCTRIEGDGWRIWRVD